MICKKCGTEMDDAQKFCDECGCQIEDEAKKEYKTLDYGEELSNCDDAEISVEDPAEEAAEEVTGEATEKVAEEEKPIGKLWLNFLSYFLLYAIAIFGALQGISLYKMGNSYREIFSLYVSAGVGAYFGILANFLLLSSFAAACLAVFVGVFLIKRKAVAPKLLYLYIGSYGAIGTLANLMGFSVAAYIKDNENIVSSLVSIGVMVAISAMAIVLNRIYFRKRESLFDK